MKVEISAIEKSFGSARVLHGVDLTIQEGEFVTFLGPSGCGKTTTLRCIAGLEDPDHGRIQAGERTFVDAEAGRYLPPHKRNVGMVFQSYALWPHMSVKSNVAYPMKRRKVPRAEIKHKVEATLTAVGMKDYADRYPHELSGGQQQRIALARGLVSANGLMLYDEPLSNLDAKLRVAMRVEVQRLHREFGNTSIYVTHDQEEALALSDRVVIMNSGRIDQVGSPKEIHSRPATRFGANFVGFENILDVEDDSRLAGGLRLTNAALKPRKGSAVAFRGKNVELSEGDARAGITGRGVIRDSEFVGEFWKAWLVTAAGASVEVTVPAGTEGFGEDGSEVDFHIRTDDVVVVE
ncbi:ABC transporter ATP-binding protein [Nesterenkonia haasae]|uniref:ABC transporter ATP-binding protein n=1 Tax=Nesterenkonia haasae TaxID=2587813 RepID=UPI001391C3F4|nr:ABC transporter ATP-binding protein [Nesterenkonia haasae]NDK31950.1 ABC transporter ATP-binding protein [Nesterenkonia haasae]